MMIGVSRFAARVEQIAARPLQYKIGGIGKNGVCDCTGLIMGAMYELGRKKYDMHSTNYFARYQTMEMKRVDQKRAYVGQILYKARDNTDGDGMNARYLPGGRYYTGDLLDYYHVGVVTGINPLRVIECTEYGKVSGIVISSSLKGWEYEGKLRGVDYSEKEVEDVLYYARVTTKEDPLTLRNAPLSGKKIGEIPRGEIVEVMSTGDWPRVKYDGMLGYASAQYLERIEEKAEQENTISVSADVTIIDSAGNRFKPVGDWRVLIGGVD